MANIPTSQAEYRLNGSGSFDVLKLNKNAAVPAPRHGEVLVRVHAVSLNNRDLQVANGTYPGANHNIIPCSDGAGEVAAVGADVKKWKVGDKVMATFTQDLLAGDVDDPALFNTMLGGGCNGMLTQYRVLPAHGLVAMPEKYSFEEAATLVCAPVTVYNALFGGNNPIKPGAWVVLQGTGGVSVAGAQMVIAAGGNAIITSSSDEKLQKVKQHINNSHNHGGAGRLFTINYKKTPDWDKEVLKLTKNGRGADKVIEIGGAGTLEKTFSCLRQGGEVDNIGYLATGEPPNLQMPVLLKSAHFRGVLIGARKHLEDLVDFLETANLHPLIDRVFSFEQAKEAYQYMSEAKMVGKVVIRVD